MKKKAKSILTTVSSLALVLIVSHTAVGQDDGDWKRNGNVLSPANPSDRVGIGENNPITTLHIGGDVHIEKGGNVGSPKLSIRSRGGGTQKYSIRVTNNRDSAGGKKFIIRNENLENAALRTDGTDVITITRPGNVGIGTTNPTAKLEVAGTTRTGVLEITGGSDLSEPFEFAGVESIRPGTVVSIDPKHRGQLLIADKAYDRTVAGIVSGANGLNPGVIMKQENSPADGSLPVALTGRVYCWADTSNGVIQPGDLLTTSDTPGHAMKVTDYAKAQGAIIGKAMSALETEHGLVLVLVALQ